VTKAGGVIVATALSLAFVALPSATATPSTKYYTVSAVVQNPPLPVTIDVATTVQVTLQNSTASSQNFGSAELTVENVPAADVAVNTPAPLPGWSATVVTGSNPAVVLLTNPSGTAIAPGSSLPVTVTFTPQTTGTLTIKTAVKQSNNFLGTGNNFINKSADPTFTVSPLGLSFTVPQGSEPPADVQASTPFCPSVQVVDAQNQPVSAANVPVSIVSGTPDAGLYFAGKQVSSTSPATVVTNSSGTATFGSSACASGLTATNLGPSFFLTASSPQTVSVNSSTFAVVQVKINCTGSCQANLTSNSNKTTAGINALVPNSDPNQNFPLSASFGQGMTLVCDSTVSTLPADPLVVSTGTVPASGTVTMTFPKAIVNSVPDNGAPHMPVCTGASVNFYGATYYPNLTPAYQGLIPDCTDAGYLAAPPSLQLFCVQSRAKHATGAETIVIQENSSLSDPLHY
jgi:hypothetical protein